VSVGRYDTIALGRTEWVRDCHSEGVTVRFHSERLVGQPCRELAGQHLSPDCAADRVSEGGPDLEPGLQWRLSARV
jgi:hypothetical protein